MKTRTKAVVIGGGIAGCSTLYHLTQEGWTDVVLVERDELTSGTTWHSAAQVTNFGMNQTMVGLKTHSINLYKELRDDPDYPVSYRHGDGGIRLANTQAQMDGYAHFASMAAGMDVEFEVIDAAECARRHPLISTDNLLGGLWDGNDGDIDPASLCQALARRARKAGAEVYRNTPVTGLTQHRDDTWTVHTTKGDIDCDVVVNAGGYRVNEVGAMMGVHHPVASMEHQYFVTEDIPAIAEAGHRMPLLRCPISDYYSRQEKGGLLIGFYEQECKPWGMDGIDPHFVNALCPDDLDRITDVLEGAFARMPALTEVGIKNVVNGPITYTIDGAPLVGPIPGKRNAFCIIGLRAGLGEGGGHGGRGAKTTPLTPILKAEGAEFTVVNGWERVDYIKPSADFHPTLGFHFDEAFPLVATEVASVQNNVGLAEVNGFNRIEITGADRHAFLDRMACGTVTRKPGRVGLGYLLNHHGMIKAEATFANIPASDRGPDRVWYGSAAASEFHDMDWLTQHPLYAAYTALRDAGAAFDLKLFGARAVESMRMEKGFLHWKSDLLTEFDPFETGLDRFVKMDKPDFIGKAALQARLDAGPSRKLVCLHLDCTHAPAHGGASVRLGGEVVGTISSGDWGHRLNANLAYGFVLPEHAALGTALTVDVIGQPVAAQVVDMGLYDPSFAKLRG